MSSRKKTDGSEQIIEQTSEPISDLKQTEISSEKMSKEPTKEPAEKLSKEAAEDLSEEDAEMIRRQVAKRLEGQTFSGEFEHPDGLAVSDSDDDTDLSDLNIFVRDTALHSIPTTEEEIRHIMKDYAPAAEKVREFPHSPGVYLMKDGSDRVIYIGKAKNLRNRAGSYFHRTALEDQRTAPLVREIRDIDFLPAASEVDALLMEARLIKDIQPKFNRDLKDSKTFPYLQITTREQFPRVEITRTPRDQGVKLFGPYLSSFGIRGALTVLQKIFKFRTCTLRIREEDEMWNWFRPCILASIHQCSAPCNGSISRADYRKNIERLKDFLDGKRDKVVSGLQQEMKEAALEKRYEEAAALRDQLLALEKLKECGNLESNAQPEVFQIDPRKGVVGLQKIFRLPFPPRIIEGVDIAHLGGKETVASVVHFIDGLPFKQGYRRYRIRDVEGVDDYASIAEVVYRRFAYPATETNPVPDILLIDGGKGQLHAACAALERAKSRPKMILSLAKREEEVFIPDNPEPIRLSRHSFALRLLQYVRDEAHRFAQHYHHFLRKKSTFGHRND